jgi:hypothetical protein
LALRSLGEVGLEILVLILPNQPYCLIIITPTAKIVRQAGFDLGKVLL